MFLVLPDPIGQAFVGQLGQVEEKVLCVPQLKGAIVEPAVRIDQFVGAFKQGIAIIALVAAGPRVTAVGTRSFHVAVRQKAACCRRIHLGSYFPVKEPIILEHQKDIL